MTVQFSTKLTPKEKHIIHKEMVILSLHLEMKRLEVTTKTSTQLLSQITNKYKNKPRLVSVFREIRSMGPLISEWIKNYLQREDLEMLERLEKK